jgi:hypothetical protein
MAALMLGTDKSRGYCLEMICADFLAGANLEGGDAGALLSLVVALALRRAVGCRILKTRKLSILHNAKNAKRAQPPIAVRQKPTPNDSHWVTQPMVSHRLL